MNSETLLKSPLQPVGDGVYEVAMPKPATVQAEPLTYLERATMLQVHKTTVERMNWSRAEQVNQYLQMGATRGEIVAYLRDLHGCGESMIKRDLTALLSAKRKS